MFKIFEHATWRWLRVVNWNIALIQIKIMNNYDQSFNFLVFPCSVQVTVQCTRKTIKKSGKNIQKTN